MSSTKDARRELVRLIRMRRLGNPEQHRRADEQINYWRQRAGWFDDEETMEEYNQGVYETYYEYDDDAYAGSRNGGGSRGGSKSAMVKNGLKVLCVLVALGLSALMFRAIMRRVGTTKKEKKRSSDSRSRSGRSKSKSRSRSRSQSRKSRSGGHGHGGSDYNLMDDDDGKSARSKRSTRSKSGSRNKRRSGRSRSRPRSRSKSRSRNDHHANKQEPAPHTEPVLV